MDIALERDVCGYYDTFERMSAVEGVWGGYRWIEYRGCGVTNV